MTILKSHAAGIPVVETSIAADNFFGS